MNIEDYSAYETSLTVKSPEVAYAENIRSLDILTFNDDSLGFLDSYQRIEDPGTTEISIATTSGKKLMFICANSSCETSEWMKVASAKSLERIQMQLEREEREYPYMAGSIWFDPDSEEHAIIPLHRMTSEVVLQSIRTDFKGKPYYGEKIRDVRIYLINVNTICGFFEDISGNPLKLVNIGLLNSDDMKEFTDPDLVVQNLPEGICDKASYPEISLRCCPNHAIEESPGSPHTRLVIEGTMQGARQYWAITVNREEGGRGIGYGGRYIYNVVISRRGSTDPDNPASPEDLGMTYKDTTWEEEGSYTILF